MATHWDRIDSPVGELLLTADEGALTGICFVSGRRPASSPAGAERGGALLATVTQQLDEYFAGTRRVFDLPLSPEGTTFQRRVWNALLAVPYDGNLHGPLPV